MTPTPVTDTRRARTTTTVRARPDKPGGHTASLIRMPAATAEQPISATTRRPTPKGNSPQIC